MALAAVALTAVVQAAVAPEVLGRTLVEGAASLARVVNPQAGCLAVGVHRAVVAPPAGTIVGAATRAAAQVGAAIRVVRPLAAGAPVAVARHPLS